jgi:hypothetical protein
MGKPKKIGQADQRQARFGIFPFLASVIGLSHGDRADGVDAAGLADRRQAIPDGDFGRIISQAEKCAVVGTPPALRRLTAYQQGKPQKSMHVAETLCELGAWMAVRMSHWQGPRFGV